MSLKKSSTKKAYAFYLNSVQKICRARSGAHTAFSSGIKNNPTELIKAIDQHALNYNEHRYQISIILDGLRTIIYVKQL